MILSSLIRGEDNNLNAKKQQQFNLGNIVFPNPVNWSEDTGRVLDTEPVYGHYRTDEYEIVMDLQDKDVMPKPDDWFRLDEEVWEYSKEEIDEKNAIIKIFDILLNSKQRESLSRYEKRIDKYLRSNTTNYYGSVRSSYPLFLPLGNAVRDMQNYWDDQNRKITG